MNEYMMSPVGVVVIAVYSFVILMIALFFSRLISSLRWRWGLLTPPVFVLLSLPWAEEAWIAWHFTEACKDAGIHVYRKVVVEGYVDDLSRAPRADQKTGLLYFDHQSLADFDKRGYRFQENMLQDGGVLHLERRSEGIVAQILEHPSARYHFRYSDPRQEVRIGRKLEKSETIVVDSVTGELMGRDTRFNRYPNLADELLLGLFGQMQTRCEAPLDQPQSPKRIGQIYRYVLIPRNEG